MPIIGTIQWMSGRDVQPKIRRPIGGKKHETRPGRRRSSGFVGVPALTLGIWIFDVSRGSARYQKAAHAIENQVGVVEQK